MNSCESGDSDDFYDSHKSGDSAEFGYVMNMVILKSLECLVNMAILAIL